MCACVGFNTVLAAATDNSCFCCSFFFLFLGQMCNNSHGNPLHMPCLASSLVCWMRFCFCVVTHNFVIATRATENLHVDLYSFVVGFYLSPSLSLSISLFRLKAQNIHSHTETTRAIDIFTNTIPPAKGKYQHNHKSQQYCPSKDSCCLLGFKINFIAPSPWASPTPVRSSIRVFVVILHQMLLLFSQGVAVEHLSRLHSLKHTSAVKTFNESLSTE